MILRWTSAAALDASKRFWRIRGYRELDHLIGDVPFDWGMSRSVLIFSERRLRVGS